MISIEALGVTISKLANLKEDKHEKMKYCICFQRWIGFFLLFLQILIFKKNSG